MDIPGAIEYVRRNGSKFENAWLDHILREGFDEREVLRGFSSIQNPDGGFPHGDVPGFPSNLSNTSMALHMLHDIGLARSEPARRAADFLVSRMTTNGTWSENEKVLPLDPPRWDMPGDADTRVWLTAAVADVLLRAGHRLPARTASFLKSHQTERGRFDGYENTTWIALSVFGERGFDDRGVCDAALAYLESNDDDSWDASSIAWCLGSMRYGNRGIDSILWRRLLDILSSTQEEDGSWPCVDGDAFKARDILGILSATSHH